MLNNKRIVILGGSAGIGFAVARRALAEGAHVVIASSNPERVSRAARELGASVTAHAVDLRDAHAVGELFGKLGPIDHLAYTAGEELLMKPLAQLDFTEARHFFELRYWGALAAIRAATPHLAKDGSIVLTSGTAGHRPHAGFVVGGSICSAMESVTRTLAVEIAPVRVNIVAPGFVDTDLWSNLPGGVKEQMFREAAARLPVRRIGTADDLAEHYLAFMRGRYVTGQVLVVDGGSVLV